MEVNETRNCLVDILLNPLNAQLFNSGGVVKLAYFQKKKKNLEYPFNMYTFIPSSYCEVPRKKRTKLCVQEFTKYSEV